MSGNPSRDGLHAIANYGAPDGDEMLLLRGIENVTNSIRRGHSVSAHAYVSYRKLIDRVDALKAALDHRETMQGGHDD